MDNLTGIFLVLIIGSVFALLYGCISLAMGVYLNAKKAKVLENKNEMQNKHKLIKSFSSMSQQINYTNKILFTFCY